MSKEFSVKDILSKIASYDSNGKSSKKIDTKKEYDLLGNYLNGEISIYSEEDTQNLNLSEYSYVLLSKDDRKVLFDTMEKLKPKFGDWQNKFSEDAEINDDNIEIYLNRLMHFKWKTESTFDPKELEKYNNENKEEIDLLEKKISEYYANVGIKIKKFNLDKLVKIRDYIEPIKINRMIKAELDSSDDKVSTVNEILLNNTYPLEDLLASFEKLNILDEEQVDLFKEVLIDYLKEYDVTEDNIMKCNYLTHSFDLVKKSFVKADEMAVCNDKIQRVINTPYDEQTLKTYVREYVKDNEIEQLTAMSENIDLGNGKFDRVSTQKNENCWIHAGINSLLSTEKGKMLIETNCYRDPETGVFAVHLQEAEDLGLHDGIYIVTPQDIIDSQETLASGEGDISAYLLAVKKYFTEVNSMSDLLDENTPYWKYMDMDEGNVGIRFYEIMTGGNVVEWKYYEPDESKISKGIATCTTFDAEKLYEMVENKHGVMTISLKNIAHNVSIVGVKDGKFLIQESNNSEDIFDGSVGVDNEVIFTKEEPIDGRPTYGISKEILSKYDLGAINYMKWE